MLRMLLAAFAALTISAALPARAQTANDAPPVLSAAEAEDLATYNAAMKALQEQGFAGLAPSLPALKAALDRAPESYAVYEQRGDVMIVRSPELADLLIATAMLEGISDRGQEAPSSVVQQPNVYPEIALVLGSEAIERGQYQEGIAYLDRGLKLQPDHWILIGEKAAAMQGQSRWAEALALVDDALARKVASIEIHAAPLHRRRGFSLIELGRLPEAKAAYEASLELEPDHQGAKQELEYIRKLEPGETQPSGIELLAPASKRP